MDAAGSTASCAAGQPTVTTGLSTTAWNFAAQFTPFKVGIEGDAFDWLASWTSGPGGHRDADHPPATGYRHRP
ncbi:hypothetical protein [Halosegnis sp.]|uniref:hypothetical protein n=1 Tax=Halosegnis sp. TaxID=2864959 RepID=UPI0035D45813